MTDYLFEIDMYSVIKQKYIERDVLDKIKEEINALTKTYPFVNHFDTYVKEDDVIKIIDKYKVESEDKMNDKKKM